MISVFLDSTVLFAAAHSKTGASRKLFYLARKGKMHLFTNETVTLETQRNLSRKSPSSIFIFKAFLDSQLMTVELDPPLDQVKAAAVYTAMKDAPIVAGAQQAKATYLATFDKKHLIQPPSVGEKSGLIILTPGSILQEI